MEMTGNKDITGLISERERQLARYCMDRAMAHGAEQVRVSLSKSVLDTCSMLNGELDKVTHCADRSVFIYIFADGRYGTFSTNMLEEESLDGFTRKAVRSVRMLAPDGFRKLPEPERTAKDACTGREPGLFDPEYGDVTSEDRMRIASGECFFDRFPASDDYRIISEECEYSDSVDDNYLIDSQGFEGRHTETSYAICSEVTLEDREGRKYSGYWWESSPFLTKLRRGSCSLTALDKAVSQIGPAKVEGGQLKMVVDTSVSSRLVSPILSALNASSIDQKTSFLEGSLGTAAFPEGLELKDLARTPGKPGSRWFDSEGIATQDQEIISGGVVKMYFVSSYMGLKMGITPNIEGVSRPVLEPFGTEPGEGAAEIMARCGSGIYVTGFNGGNCNATTGNFSYGIEGFVFKEGKVLHPVREMIVTGNMMELWNHLILAGDDARECTRWQIPTLAFEDCHFA